MCNSKFSVNFVFADFPYNLRGIQEDDNSNRAISAFADMKELSTIGNEMLSFGAHAHIFVVHCSLDVATV